MLKFLFFLATFKREVQRQRKKKSYIASLPITLIKILKFNFQTCLPHLLVETQTWVKKHDGGEGGGGGDRPKKLNIYW
jgi:hypothetical protein